MNKFSLDTIDQPTQNKQISFLELKEIPVKFIVNSLLQVEIICTPNKLEELAIGWIFSTVEGISMEDIENIEVLTNKAQVKINLKEDFKLCRKSFSESVVNAVQNCSGCNSEGASVKQKADIKTLKTYAKKLNSMRSKGLHGAMLFSRKTFVYCEDISRHCAIDKAVGSMIKLGMDIESSVLVTTGRISSELLWKAKLLKIPVVASLKYPSETGILLSNAWGITVVSKVLCDDVEIF